MEQGDLRIRWGPQGLTPARPVVALVKDLALDPSMGILL